MGSQAPAWPRGTFSDLHGNSDFLTAAQGQCLVNANYNPPTSSSNAGQPGEGSNTGKRIAFLMPICSKEPQVPLPRWCPRRPALGSCLHSDRLTSCPGCPRASKVLHFEKLLRKWQNEEISSVLVILLRVKCIIQPETHPYQCLIEIKSEILI